MLPYIDFDFRKDGNHFSMLYQKKKKLIEAVLGHFIAAHGLCLVVVSRACSQFAAW